MPSQPEKDAEIERLRSEVHELKKGLSDMGFQMGAMRKEFSMVCLAMGRAMGYVDPKEGESKPVVSKLKFPSSSSKAPKADDTDSINSADYSVSSKQEKPATAITTTPTPSPKREAKSPPPKPLASAPPSPSSATSPAASLFAENSSNSSLASTQPSKSMASAVSSLLTAPAPLKFSQTAAVDVDVENLGPASDMSASGEGFSLSPDRRKAPAPTAAAQKGVIAATDSKLFQLSDSEFEESSSSTDMNDSERESASVA